MQKNIAILGSTGSIGTQALSVIGEFPSEFKVSLLTARNNMDLLLNQARTFLPEKVVLTQTGRLEELKHALRDLPVEVMGGEDALLEALHSTSTDMVLSSLMGFAGLLPALETLRLGKPLALANKETLVVAGELVTRVAAENKVDILPVDSEHSAIFQCLAGEEGNTIDKVILTASGGPFRGRDRAFLSGVGVAEALNHPNWSMGKKITIDSASLMNKGLEAIEARWLFNLEPSQIEIILHPQSIIHSMVRFEDGSVKAQMALPDMRLPILYAFAYPKRMKAPFPKYSPADFPELSFEAPDPETFRNLALGLWAMQKGGNAPCVLNAANEIAVDAFLNEKTGFLNMPEIIEYSLQKVPFIPHPELNDYLLSDREARIYATEFIA